MHETSSEEKSVLASKGSAAVTKRKKVPTQKFLPAYHKAYLCLVPSKKSSEFAWVKICQYTEIHKIKMCRPLYFDNFQNKKYLIYIIFSLSFCNPDRSILPEVNVCTRVAGRG